MKENIKERISNLKKMNQAVIGLGDENLWETWIAVAVPDEPSDEDYEYIAKNETIYNDVVRIFAQIVLWYLKEE